MSDSATKESPPRRHLNRRKLYVLYLVASFVAVLFGLKIYGTETYGGKLYLTYDPMAPEAEAVRLHDNGYDALIRSDEIISALKRTVLRGEGSEFRIDWAAGGTTLGAALPHSVKESPLYFTLLEGGVIRPSVVVLALNSSGSNAANQSAGTSNYRLYPNRRAFKTGQSAGPAHLRAHDALVNGGASLVDYYMKRAHEQALAAGVLFIGLAIAPLLFLWLGRALSAWLHR